MIQIAVEVPGGSFPGCGVSPAPGVSTARVGRNSHDRLQVSGEL
jgi:hypothetical protein